MEFCVERKRGTKKKEQLPNQICLTNQFVSAHAGFLLAFIPGPKLWELSHPISRINADHPQQGRAESIENQTEICQSKRLCMHPLTAIEVSTVMYQ